MVTAMTPVAGLIPLSPELHWCSSRFGQACCACRWSRGDVMGAMRVTFWGALAMALTAGVGSLFGTVP